MDQKIWPKITDIWESAPTWKTETKQTEPKNDRARKTKGAKENLQSNFHFIFPEI